MKKTTLVLTAISLAIALISCSNPAPSQPQTKSYSPSLENPVISSSSASTPSSSFSSSVNSTSSAKSSSKAEALIPVEIIESSSEMPDLVEVQPPAPATPVELEFLSVGETGTDTTGMSVTLDSLTRSTNQDTTTFSISYTLKNETSNIVEEGYFKAYFTDGTVENQYGAFGKLMPDESVSMQYDFEMNGNKELLTMQYHYFKEGSMRKERESNQPWADALNWK